MGRSAHIAPALGAGMRTMVKRLVDDTSGATAIEYAMIAALIFVVIISTVALIGENQTAMYAYIGDHITAALESRNAE